jgi:azurin
MTAGAAAMIQISARRAPSPQNLPESHPIPKEQHIMMRKLIAIALLGLLSTPLMAAECATTIEGSDAMQFNVGSITVPASCAEFKITLKHTGQMPVAAMGHNIVIAAAADMQGIAADGIGAGVAADYIKAGDARVIAHSKLVGGGESATISFPVSKLGGAGPYEFFCSFPGHDVMMKGSIAVG